MRKINWLLGSWRTEQLLTIMPYIILPHIINCTDCILITFMESLWIIKIRIVVNGNITLTFGNYFTYGTRKKTQQSWNIWISMDISMLGSLILNDHFCSNNYLSTAPCEHDQNSLKYPLEIGNVISFQPSSLYLC